MTTLPVSIEKIRRPFGSQSRPQWDSLAYGFVSWQAKRSSGVQPSSMARLSQAEARKAPQSFRKTMGGRRRSSMSHSLTTEQCRALHLLANANEEGLPEHALWAVHHVNNA